MPFTREQIIAIDNLYAKLGTADQLVEHKEELNLLALENQQKVALKLVQQWPAENLPHLTHAIRALKGPMSSPQEGTFAHTLTQVWTLRKNIMALTDARHPSPHTLLLAPEFNIDLFAEFKAYSLELLEGNELAIAQKLATTTPKEQRSTLVRNIQNAFAGSQFVTVVAATFAFRRELDTLLGDEPYKFFTSPEFNAQAYLRYSDLLKLVTDKDEEIVANLANTPNVKRMTVLAQMEAIFPDSTLLAKTKKVFKTPAKETVLGGSMFATAPQAATAEKNEAQEQTSLSA